MEVTTYEDAGRGAEPGADVGAFYLIVVGLKLNRGPQYKRNPYSYPKFCIMIDSAVRLNNLVL
jgi:hypothetical protein